MGRELKVPKVQRDIEKSITDSYIRLFCRRVHFFIIRSFDSVALENGFIKSVWK